MNAEEIRYGFGKNWSRFVRRKVGRHSVDAAQKKLLETLHLPNLKGKTFLDVGCGSGLHSFAAVRAGAKQVDGFDYDPYSVAATDALRNANGNPSNWTAQRGSALDEDFLKTLKPADIVYSWGVLHHTGDMWNAIRNTGKLLADDGVLFIALYAYEAYPDAEYWLRLKRRYNQSTWLGQRYLELKYILAQHVEPSLRSPRAAKNFLSMLTSYNESRGMDFYTDVRDWLGGYPMEFAWAKDVKKFAEEEMGLRLLHVIAGQGNTEFIFAKKGSHTYWDELQFSWKELPRPFRKVSGHAWEVDLPTSLEGSGDTEVMRTNSPLVLFEDSDPLLLGHSDRGLLAKLGDGRYSHAGRTLQFSSSDGSNPQENGRVYKYYVAPSVEVRSDKHNGS